MSIQLPSVLAFERKLEVSDALMHAGDWETRNSCEWKKVPITKRQNRSTQSSQGIADDKKDQPNPVASDSDDANLFQETNTLRVSFSLRVIGNLGKPFSCNSPDFESSISDKVNTFKESEGVSELAYRYAYNIANGRFLWRNRVGAEELEIQVSVKDLDTQTYNAYDFSLQNFSEKKELVKELATVIEKGLKEDENNCSFIEVIAYAKLGMGQHVFPSQKMNMGEDGKVLFQLEDCAAMHSVKIGNAIRTIDNWHGDTDELPIAAEPFGAVTQRGKKQLSSLSEIDSQLRGEAETNQRLLES